MIRVATSWTTECQQRPYYQIYSSHVWIQSKVSCSKSKIGQHCLSKICHFSKTKLQTFFSFQVRNINH